MFKEPENRIGDPSGLSVNRFHDFKLEDFSECVTEKNEWQKLEKVAEIEESSDYIWFFNVLCS